MDREILELKRRAGILTEGDVVPFGGRAATPQPEPQAGKNLEEERYKAMLELARVLGEELAPIKHDKAAVKAHMKDVVDNLVMQVMMGFMD